MRKPRTKHPYLTDEEFALSAVVVPEGTAVSFADLSALFEAFLKYARVAQPGSLVRKDLKAIERAGRLVAWVLWERVCTDEDKAALDA